MIEQFFQIGENWIDKEQYAFQLGDAILFLCFLIFVLYLFVFAIYSKRKPQYNYPTAKKKYRFAVLFPAYQEDEVIIDSVKIFSFKNIQENDTTLSLYLIRCDKIR